jgi:hypothetical protein
MARLFRKVNFELARAVRLIAPCNRRCADLRGVVYDPFRRDRRLSSDTGVNYLFAATKSNLFIEPNSIASMGATTSGGEPPRS